MVPSFTTDRPFLADLGLLIADMGQPRWPFWRVIALLIVAALLAALWSSSQAVLRSAPRGRVAIARAAERD